MLLTFTKKQTKILDGCWLPNRYYSRLITRRGHVRLCISHTYGKIWYSIYIKRINKVKEIKIFKRLRANRIRLLMLSMHTFLTSISPHDSETRQLLPFGVNAQHKLQLHNNEETTKGSYQQYSS